MNEAELMKKGHQLASTLFKKKEGDTVFEISEYGIFGLGGIGAWIRVYEASPEENQPAQGEDR